MRGTNGLSSSSFVPGRSSTATVMRIGRSLRFASLTVTRNGSRAMVGPGGRPACGPCSAAPWPAAGAASAERAANLTPPNPPPAASTAGSTSPITPSGRPPFGAGGWFGADFSSAMVATDLYSGFWRARAPALSNRCLRVSV